MNRILFKGIKKNPIQIRSNKGECVDELPVVLWSLRTTPSQATGETLFSLVYGLETVLPAEAGLPTYRQTGFTEEENGQRMREQLNFVDELRDQALYKMQKYKHLMVAPTIGGSRTNNLSRILGPDSYEHETMNGDAMPRTWHASNLTKYYV
ncbi:hypothetical protein LIER_21022 [Lithospermum erythrorhizon]|uniref:Uncharacterized protein n=1 Tax=Lithospermum erythrorhizon TaxID=34254 RepID=A0AAV3QNS5_LITER